MYNGYYKGFNIYGKKNITIIGENPKNTVINQPYGEAWGASFIHIDDSRNIKISNFTIKNEDKYFNVDYKSLSRILNEEGLFFAMMKMHHWISPNIGIFIISTDLVESENIVISNNIIENFLIGIYIFSVVKNKFYRNEIRNNVVGIYIPSNVQTAHIYGRTLFNEIYENNFLNNVIDGSDGNEGEYNIWMNNYWGRIRFLPKIIPGVFFSLRVRSAIDWNPAKRPYEI